MLITIEKLPNDDRENGKFIAPDTLEIRQLALEKSFDGAFNERFDYRERVRLQNRDKKSARERQRNVATATVYVSHGAAIRLRD